MVSIYQGLTNAGFEITSRAWIEDFETVYKKSREDWRDSIFRESEGRSPLEFFQIYASHAYTMPFGRKIQEEDFGGADTAVYVLARIAGEGADRFNEKGDYYLTDHEKQDLEMISGSLRECDRGFECGRSGRSERDSSDTKCEGSFAFGSAGYGRGKFPCRCAYRDWFPVEN